MCFTLYMPITLENENTQFCVALKMGIPLHDKSHNDDFLKGSPLSASILCKTE